MLLAVDIGNTHFVFGLFRDEELLADWRIATRTEVTADELGVLIHALFDNSDFDPRVVDDMIVSSGCRRHGLPSSPWPGTSGS